MLFSPFHFNLRRLLPKHFGLRKAYSLHDGEKCNLKKIIKLIASAYSFSKVDELICTVAIFNLGNVVNGPFNYERKQPRTLSVERLTQGRPAVPNRLPSVGASWLLTRTMCVLEPKRKRRWEEGPDGQRGPEGEAGGSTLGWPRGRAAAGAQQAGSVLCTGLQAPRLTAWTWASFGSFRNACEGPGPKLGPKSGADRGSGQEGRWERGLGLNQGQEHDYSQPGFGLSVGPAGGSEEAGRGRKGAGGGRAGAGRGQGGGREEA